MFLSVVIPAYNESQCIVETVRLARAALQEAGLGAYEVVVADDASTDDTARLAEEAGARVVTSGKRNIGGTRNVGAAAARGTHIVFVDADTKIHADLVRAAVRAFEQGAVAGGARICFEGEIPRWMKFCLNFWNGVSRLLKWSAGSFFFVRRDIFEAVGGFDERFYFSEEIDLSKRIKKHGRLVILKEACVTSPRKANQFSLREHRRLLWKMIRHPRRIHSRENLDYWYERREG